MKRGAGSYTTTWLARSFDPLFRIHYGIAACAQSALHKIMDLSGNRDMNCVRELLFPKEIVKKKNIFKKLRFIEVLSWKPVLLPEHGAEPHYISIIRPAINPLQEGRGRPK